MSIQGNPGGSAGILIDGMTNLAGFLPGDFGEASVSPEAVQELTVFTGNVAAEQGRQSGGTMNFTLKSGTNRPHGAVFYYLRNEIFNANNWNNNLYLAADPNFTKSTTRSFIRPLDRRKDYGFTFGGPVYIPSLQRPRPHLLPIHHGALQHRDPGPGSLSWSVPQPEMWNGDLSRLRTGNQVGVDALGRTVVEGQIYDPTTLSQVNGRYVADPFVGNIIPASICLRGQELRQSVQRVVSAGELQHRQQHVHPHPEPAGRQAVHRQGGPHPRRKARVSGYYYKHGFPRNFQGNGQRSLVAERPRSRRPAVTLHPAAAARLQLEHQVRSDGLASILSHPPWASTTTAMPSTAAGRQVVRRFLGHQGHRSRRPRRQVTRPVISLGGSPVATFQSWDHDANRDEFYRSIVLGNRQLAARRPLPQVRHRVEHLRYDSRQFNNTGGTFNFAARTTAIPAKLSPRASATASPASYWDRWTAPLSAHLQPRSPPDTMARRSRRTWKVSSKLTLTYGLRWSGNSPQYEESDRIANFNPFLPDPNYGDRLGAVEYMGNGAGRAGRRAPSPETGWISDPPSEWPTA